MKSTQQFRLNTASFIVASIFVGLAIAGAIRTYSPVPFWDMWNGTLGFIMRVSEGDLTAWWEQHNEHRIVLARLLFWFNFKLTSGASWFLILVNYLLVIAGIAIFCRIARDVVREEEWCKVNIVVGCMIAIWLFQWMQHENLTWAFQSQFFLAQLLPICALYWLHKSLEAERFGKEFIIAVGFGVASAGTMANGILALPLMTVYATVTRQSASRILLLGILSCTIFILYFFDYHSPAGHGKLSQTLRDNPLGVIEYTLLYLGSPFYYIFGKGKFGYLVAVSAAIFLVIATVASVFDSIRKPKSSSLNLVLIFYIAYLAGTALGTAGGRLIFGVNQALSYRYTTPALMAWAALAIIWLPRIIKWARRHQRKSAVLIFVMILLMLSGQIKAIKPQRENIFEKDLAALALELGVIDKNQLGRILPLADAYLNVANEASERDLSVFATYPFKDLRKQIGAFIDTAPMLACQGHVDRVTPVEGDNNRVMLSGWIFNLNQFKSPRLLSIADASGKIVGFALTGWPRLDVAQAIHKDAFFSGFRGYMLKETFGDDLIIRGDSFPCELRTMSPAKVQSVTPEEQMRPNR